MEKFEESVLEYICGRPQRFVNPQFAVEYEDSRGGSCPDFVVVDFLDSTIYVVEVTMASSIRALVERIGQRETRWIAPLRRHFQRLNEIFKIPPWEFHVTIFVRSEQLGPARKKFASETDVSVFALDEVIFPWRWNWQKGIPLNPLRAPGKEVGES